MKLKIRLLLSLAFVCLLNNIVLSQISPNELEFRRMATKRIIFDRSQNIALSGLSPAKIVGMDVMHPAVGEQKGHLKLNIDKGFLNITSQESGASTRWVGAFNPFATYDLAINNFSGSGEIGLFFKDSDAENSIKATLVASNGMYQSVSVLVIKNGLEVDRFDFELPEELSGDNDIRFQVQMMAVGANLYIEQHKQTTLIGRFDFVKHFDLRKKELMHRFEFLLHTELDANAMVDIIEANSFLSPGMGQSDMRVVTYEDGSTYFKEDRIWVLMTVRGGGLPHPMQGVYSLNPSVFDITFEGIILYDRGDGLLRNDLASNIFYDRTAKEWRGFTTGFSSYGDPKKKEKKQLWGVQSSRMPLQGISIMKAKTLGLIGNYEDPQCIYDAEVKKWRMLYCESHGGYKAVIRESDTWDGTYKMIAGPVKENSTGTQLQKIGGKYYALYGSADRKVYVKTYPDLEPAGTLNILRPPWDEKINTRIWPNVIPMPEGYPAPYIALMMDRLNFPGMTGDNWTYGAMYLYHGFEK